MILLMYRRKVVLIAALVLLSLPVIGYEVRHGLPASAPEENPGYRIYVQGLGTVQGIWAGRLGIAIIGVETRPDTDPAKELKVITLLVANQSKEKIRFDSDIALVDNQGNVHALHGAGQPVVEIKPGTVSQGVVIIDVPRGISNGNWTLKISGGPVSGPVKLPLKVVTVKAENNAE